MLETFLVYPNVFHDPPGSLELGMRFMAVRGPSDYFPPLGLLSWVTGVGALALAWPVRAAAAGILLSLAMIVGEGAASVLFFWPRNEILFVEGQAVHSAAVLRRVAQEFQTLHWSRLAFKPRRRSRSSWGSCGSTGTGSWAGPARARRRGPRSGPGPRSAPRSAPSAGRPGPAPGPSPAPAGGHPPPPPRAGRLPRRNASERRPPGRAGAAQEGRRRDPGPGRLGGVLCRCSTTPAVGHRRRSWGTLAEGGGLALPAEPRCPRKVRPRPAEAALRSARTSARGTAARARLCCPAR